MQAIPYTDPQSALDDAGLMRSDRRVDQVALPAALSAFLDRGGPHTQGTRSATPRRNWVATDAELVARLRHAAWEAETARPPVRVTLVELERRLGLRGWIGNCRAKLPQANREVDALASRPVAFQRRRAACQVERRLDAGEPVAAWRVMRAVGVRRSSLKEVVADGCVSCDAAGA